MRLSIIMRAVAGAVLLAIAAAAWFTAPTSGDFWWSDAPRHALNGVFLADMLRDLPFADPAGYAFSYYEKYPALTLLFYPPLFYVISAPFFLVLGASHATAQFVVALHLFALGIGGYAIARLYLRSPAALAVAMALVALPEVLLWGRQVMLEVPAFAFLAGSLALGLRYADRARARPSLLYLCLFLFLCAMYTKISVAFALPALGAAWLHGRGWSLLRERHTWIAGALFAIGLLPLVFITLKFGQANVQSVSGVADAVAPRWSIAGWTWYLRQLPSQMGWAPLALAAAGAVLLFRSRASDGARRTFLVVYLAIGYIFFSLIDLKEARHSVFLLLPLAVLAGVALERGAELAKLPAAPVAVAGIVAAYGLFWTQTPSYGGYRDAVEFVAKAAPPGSTVVFSGKRDGSFIFNMRTIAGRPDLAVVRADKLLLSVAVRRELGVEQKQRSEEEIAGLIGEVGARYVVAQVDFWTDLEVMARLQTVLRSNRFEEVARIPVRTDFPQDDRELRIYRTTGPVAFPPKRPDIDLPIIRRTIPAS